MRAKFRILELTVDTDDCLITLIDREGKAHKIKISEASCLELEQKLSGTQRTTAQFKNPEN